MKSIIICNSKEHRNTLKLANVIASEINADIIEVGSNNEIDFQSYDLIGIGSGIKMGDIYKTIYSFLETKSLEGKDVFLFSTSGCGNINTLAKARRFLISKKANIVGEFVCKGLSTFAFLKLIGGMNKQRPNARDLEDCRSFAKGLNKL